MNENEKAYKEKLKHFFSDDVLETNSVSELQEKLRRRQLLFPNAQVNDFIKANLKIDNVLKDKNIKTSLSKEEQKNILKDAPKNIGEAWERTSLARSCKTPVIKKAALESKKDLHKPTDKKTDTIGKNYYAIKSILTLLKFRKIGCEPVDFENNAIFTEIKNKNTELTEQESELMGEYKKYKKRISNKRIFKLRYVKRSEIPKEELEEIRAKEREYKKINALKNRGRESFQKKFRFHKLSEEKKEELRKRRKEYAKKWREANLDKNNKRSAEYREKNREAIREQGRRAYHRMSEEKRKAYLETKRKWHEANKEKLKAYNKIYLKENKDKFREATKRFKQKNPERVREVSNNYYHRHKEAIAIKRREKRLLKSNKQE